uniref:Uncharacterized protein n=1 Tax=Myotis myotis TaxID=51298 RepID=A0A7J7SBY7_MYOMY|nr:hypothetical protein mMyoMyo1_009481 [Myotis myotis]
MCMSMLNHHFLWFLFCFGFAQILAKMRLFVSSCREGLRLSFLLVLGLLLLPEEPKRQDGLPLSPQLSLGGGCGPWSPLAPSCPQACPPQRPGSGSGREAASSQHTQIAGLGSRGQLGSLLWRRT